MLPLSCYRLVIGTSGPPLFHAGRELSLYHQHLNRKNAEAGEQQRAA